MPQFIDLTGLTIRNFKIIERAFNSANGRTRWLCRCVCGRETVMHGSRSAFLRQRSCGCKRNVAHGNRRANYTSPEYQSWRAMRNRCLNGKDKHFKDYGGRGISICPQWKSFMVFLSDMGPREVGMSLDRIDHDGNYSPDNCRWATASIQAKNKRSRKAIENFSDDVFLREYGRRFPDAEYGLVGC